MIPLIYRLRESIRFEDRGEYYLVASEAPLNVIRSSRRAVRILELCDGQRTVSQVALSAGIAEEDTVFKICDYFNRKAVLETAVAANPGYYPAVSIIIPTWNRAESLVECIESLYTQEYDPSRIEIIVVDDGSQDETQKLAGNFPCTLLANKESRGQAYSRNLGARHAKNEIIAFLDDDCVAGKTWLRDLVPYFQWDAIGAVGGYVDGYADRTRLERYEKTFSLLNLGRYILRGANDRSRFYVPTCNMLVRKKAFQQAGGIRETMHLGEDVDFCWKMRDAGWQALYIPSGTVRHKHRTGLIPMLRRRADYGTSEAVLASFHPRRVKRLQWSPPTAAAFLGLCCAIAFFSLFPLLVTGACYIAETAIKVFRLQRKRIRISPGQVCSSVFRKYMSCFYMLSFHLARYYLVPLLLLGIAFHPLWILAFCFLLLAASVDYSARRPRLALPAFFFYNVLDHISYQIGVLSGCLRARSLRAYRVRFFL